MAVDVKKWLNDNMEALGLSDAEKAIAEKLVESGKFKGDFVHFSDMQSQLDRQKTQVASQYEAKVNELTNYNIAWQEQYEERFAPAVAAVERLREAGYDVSGLRDDGRGGAQNRGGQTLTMEDVERLVAQRIEPVRVGAVDYSTFIADKAVEFREEYGKRFDAAKFRKFAYENREQFPSYDAAYDAYTAEERKAKEINERKKWEDETREQIRLEVMSSATLPEMAGGSEGSPLFESANKEVDRNQARQEFAKKFPNGFNIST